MKAYEIMYIVKPTANELLDAINDKFKTLIENNGGIVEKLDNWGKKRLAYEINGFNDGLYVLVTFKAMSACTRELDRVMKITDEVLRHMIIRKGE